MEVISQAQGGLGVLSVPAGNTVPTRDSWCPEKRTAVKIMQSSGYGLMETAARLHFCSAIRALPYGKRIAEYPVSDTAW